MILKEPKKSSKVEMIADLDAILSESVTFRLHGKIHTLKPLTVEEFLVYSRSLCNLVDLKEKETVTPSELVDCYYDLAHSVCSTIVREDIEKMTQGQVAALYQTILDTVTGKAFGEKKTLMTMLQANQ